MASGIAGPLWRLSLFVAVLCASLAWALQETEGDFENDPGLSRFVSRPDIRATKWNVTIYHEELLAPGYWFVGPYRLLDDASTGNGWAGAMIYDGKGELVWSGADMFSRGNFEDFRVSNVRGEPLLTLMDQGPGAIVVFNNHYEILESRHVIWFNSHELNFIDNGTRALIVRLNPRDTTPEQVRKVGFDGECRVDFDEFQELDVMDDWKPVFDWSSWDRIGLEESTYVESPIHRRCAAGTWDYLHLNSVDKTDSGDYVLSGRHSDAIYKVSKDTGDIIWRLGGVKSDFPQDDRLTFRRQHDVRYRGHNDTHMFLSILDNAKGIDHTVPPVQPFSRGLLLAVNEKDMTFDIERQFDHPMTEDRYSPRRGNYQVLPNGNTFMGWSEQGVQSEHSPDGTLLMEAIFAVNWLGTYRHYKFPYVGAPRLPPDIHAEAISTGDETASTIVHVSWNGATEVHSYQLLKATASGMETLEIATAYKTGFETVMVHNGLASRVLVNAIDAHGNVLGRSKIFDTIVHENVSQALVTDEHDWCHGLWQETWIVKFRSIFKQPMATFVSGFFCSAAILLVVWYVRRRGFRFTRRIRYHRLRQGEKFPDAVLEPLTEVADRNASPSPSSSSSAHDRRRTNSGLDDR